MRAVAYQHSLPIEDPLSLQDVELPDPSPAARDLLVEVRAVAVNPIDTKQRKRAQPKPRGWAVLGYDAVGIVREVGSDVTGFALGTASGTPARSTDLACTVELHVVDERIAGPKPRRCPWPRQLPRCR